MKITILNGNFDNPNLAFEEYLAQLGKRLEASQDQVTQFNLRDMDLRYCVGCFGCWVKTPGECITPDDGPQVLKAMINADFVLWAAPTRMGFPDAILKKMMDKSIPLIHPYFVVDHGEAHHRARYQHYPLFGLLLAKESGCDEEDLRIISGCFSRMALNLKTRLVFSMTTGQPVELTAQAILAPGDHSVQSETYTGATQGKQVKPPMRITVFNGSPRGAKGNTPLMMEQFLKGFSSLPGRSFEIHHLAHVKDSQHFVQAYAEAECAWLGFPLYTDAMPGIVKAFIEGLEPFVQRENNPAMGFLVQSGFPEAAHSRQVERYLQKLAQRLGSPYLGTLVKGGGEGITGMPASMTRKLFDHLYQLGKTFAETGQLDPERLQQMAKPERYPAYSAPLFKLVYKLPIASFYFDGQLKQNGVFEQRFNHPYGD